MIFEQTDAEDYLNLLLTCKSFRAHLPKSLQDVMREKHGSESDKWE